VNPLQLPLRFAWREVREIVVVGSKLHEPAEKRNDGSAFERGEHERVKEKDEGVFSLGCMISWLIMLKELYDF
jgi:hypothetical protein